MYHRRLYGSFAEYSEESIRGNGRRHLTNIEEQERKRIRSVLNERTFRLEQPSAKGLT